MPKIDDRPNSLRPYLFHGLDLSWRDGDKNATAQCPWCGREGKFSAKIETGIWRCWNAACSEQGNARVFLRTLWKASDEVTTDYGELAQDRSLQQPDTLMHWGVVRSTITNDWLVPGYSIGGKLNQLYRYVERSQHQGRLLPTPTLGHQLHGVNLYDKNKSVVYLCEGPWDAMVLWETLRSVKETGEGEFASTANLAVSLLSNANVLAVPGCMVFFPAWTPLFAGKRVNLMYDNDHPRKHPKTGKMLAPAGLGGARRTAAILMAAKNAPREINFIEWGKGGYSPDLANGYDVRDCLRE